MTDGHTLLRPVDAIGTHIDVGRGEVGIVRRGDESEILHSGRHSISGNMSRAYLASTSSFEFAFRLTGPTENSQPQDSAAAGVAFTVGGHLTTYRVRVTLSVVPEYADQLLGLLTESNASRVTVTRPDVADVLRAGLRPETMFRLSMYQLSNSKDRKLLSAIADALQEVLDQTVSPYGLIVEGLRVEGRRRRARAVARFAVLVSGIFVGGATFAVFLVVALDQDLRTISTDFDGPNDLLPTPLPTSTPDPYPFRTRTLPPPVTAKLPLNPSPTPDSMATVVAMILSSKPEPASVPTVEPPPTPTWTPVPQITPLPIVMPLPARDEYNIRSVSVNLMESGEGTFTADWMVTVENIAATSASRAIPIYMSVDGGAPELIGYVSDVQRGDAETFVFPATVDSQATIVDFSVGDAHYQVSLDDLPMDRSDSTSVPEFDSLDRAVLVELYNSTGGANWTDNTNWLGEKPIDQWYGVETDSNGRVIVLDLHDNGLRGAIPASLGDLAELSVLELSSNRLTGSIPSQLGKLPTLIVLALFDNRLTGSIPPDLAEMDKLVALSLEDNLFTGCIPDGLRNINLQFVDLDTLGLPFCETAQSEGLEGLMELVERMKASFQDFYVITTELDEYGDHDLECKSLLGSEYRLADWNDLKYYHASGGPIEALIAGLDWKDEKTSDVGVRHPRVSRDGNERYNGGRRHYFVSRHDHVPPSYFLVHDNIDSYHLSLGSWYGEGGEVLCTTLGEWSTQTVTAVEPTIGSQSPPRADAGPDQSVRPGDLVVLDGSGSSPDATHFWAVSVIGVTGCQLDRGSGCNDYVHNQLTLSDPTSQTLTFTAPELVHGATHYVIHFELTVTRDGLYSSDATEVRISRR